MKLLFKNELYEVYKKSLGHHQEILEFRCVGDTDRDALHKETPGRFFSDFFASFGMNEYQVYELNSDLDTIIVGSSVPSVSRDYRIPWIGAELWYYRHHNTSCPALDWKEDGYFTMDLVPTQKFRSDWPRVVDLMVERMREKGIQLGEYKDILERTEDFLNFNVLEDLNTDLEGKIDDYLYNFFGEEPKEYRFTWRHEVSLMAKNPEEARRKWEGLQLGGLDWALSQGEIINHNFIEEVSFEDGVGQAIEG